MSMQFYLKADLYFRKIEDLALIPKLIKGTIINGDKKFTQELKEIIQRDGLEFVVGVLSRKIVTNQIDKIQNLIKTNNGSAYFEIDKILYYLKPTFETLKVDKELICQNFYGLNKEQTNLLISKIENKDSEISGLVTQFFDKIDGRNLNKEELKKEFLLSINEFNPTFSKFNTNDSQEFDNFFEFLQFNHSKKLYQEFIPKFILYCESNNLNNDLISPKILSTETNISSLATLKYHFQSRSTHTSEFSKSLIHRIKRLQLPMESKFDCAVFIASFPEYYLLSDTTITPDRYLPYATKSDSDVLILKDDEVEEDNNILTLPTLKSQIIKCSKIKSNKKNEEITSKAKDYLDNFSFRKDKGRVSKFIDRCSVYIETSPVAEIATNLETNHLFVTEIKSIENIIVEKIEKVNIDIVNGQFDAKSLKFFDELETNIIENSQNKTQKEFKALLTEDFIDYLESVVDSLNEPLKSIVRKVIKAHEKNDNTIKTRNTAKSYLVDEQLEHNKANSVEIEILLLTCEARERIFLFAELCAENMIYVEDLLQFRLSSAESVFEYHNTLLDGVSLGLFDSTSNFTSLNYDNYIPTTDYTLALSNLLDTRNNAYQEPILNPTNVSSCIDSATDFFENSKQYLSQIQSNYTNDLDTFLNSPSLVSATPIATELANDCKEVIAKIEEHLEHNRRHNNSISF